MTGSSQAVRVFVYGTLKRGLRNYPVMQGAGVSQVQSAFLKGFALYNVASIERPYPYPCLVSGRGMVMGELHTLGASELEPGYTSIIQKSSRIRYGQRGCVS